MRFNNLLQWLSWLEQSSTQNKKIKLGITHLLPIAQKLKVINFSVPVVLVAGTNGKGTTIASLEQIYQSAGYNTAAYTSPHFIRFNERLRIDGSELSDNLWCEAFAEIDAMLNPQAEHPPLSYFEYTVLAGLYIIKEMQHKLDVVLLEIGMGGRLDAMNIVEPSVSVITTIDLDHMEYLGNNRDAIALEKAGIMREDKLTICGDRNPPASLFQAAREYGAQLLCQGQDFWAEVSTTSWTWQSGDMVLENLPLSHVPIQNVATALQVVLALHQQLPIGLNSIKTALAQIKLQGRMQRLQNTPEVIVDVAHNPQAGQYLAEQLPIKRQNYGKIIAVIGMKADEDIEQTIAPMKVIVDSWYVADLHCLNGAAAQAIIPFLKDRNCASFSSIEKAYQQALADAADNDTIIVFGSFFSVGPIMELKRETIIPEIA
jgi:dihydrofolate synthase/folylpolyglutamate synthase